ncbi:hypothetical protein cyc_01853 [Cyclospora cayetanensis]|uniref:Trichohyalin n=1 Tax=Cyclospora cayetanensis TaxID=88456 RepID=A0A1D3D6D1_9EIME|nr:hypothetical protein cyc_01853 [Cyclospora cayetanensis]
MASTIEASEDIHVELGTCAKDEVAAPPHRKTTQDLTEEFKDLNWAKVDEFNSFKAKLEEEAREEDRLRKQKQLRDALEDQLREQKLAKELQKREILESAKELQKDLELWKKQEREKEEKAYVKMLLQKEVLDAQMQERQKLQEETIAEQLRESREVLEQVSRDLELEKRRAQKAKVQKARAMQEILEVTAAERRLAEARAKKEQEEDMRLLKLSVQLEKEAAERVKQERQTLLNLHQSRADRIAMLTSVDKARSTITRIPIYAPRQRGILVQLKGVVTILQKELATQSALKRDAADQARRQAMEKEAMARKKAEQLEVHEFLKLQRKEKEQQKELERQERHQLQKLQELDAQEYKAKEELAQRNRRALLKSQQELLVKQMEERKLNKDILVSQTEMKLNRRLLEEVNDYLLHKTQAAPAVESDEV